MAGLLSKEDVLKGFESLYDKKYKKILPESFSSSVEKMILKANSSQQAAIELESQVKIWSEAKKVRILDEVIPDGILPEEHSGNLYDIRIHAHASDDQIYFENPDIQKMIPRGVTLMRLQGTMSWFDIVLYANRKFTGGIGDEDDTQPENNDAWKKYFLAPPETTSEVISMTKLNGETAHFSGRYINEEFFICTGSKNVHLLIKEAADIDRYEGDRYTVAKQVAKSVCETLEGLKEEHRQLVFSFLHHTKCTAVCEILQPNYQHIVNLSHLEKPLLNVITFTSTLGSQDESSLTALPPHHSLEILAALGFPTPSFVSVLPKDLSSHQQTIKKLMNSEGEVLYYINDRGYTIGMVKVKSFWYVLMRALREKAIFCFLGAKRRPNWSLESMINSTMKRFSEIQNWLNFSNEYLIRWQKLGSLFLRWLEKEIVEKRVTERQIQPRFPRIWRNFLEDEGETDDFSDS